MDTTRISKVSSARSNNPSLPIVTSVFARERCPSPFHHTNNLPQTTLSITQPTKYPTTDSPRRQQIIPARSGRNGPGTARSDRDGRSPPLACGRGGIWGTDLYVVAANGNLLRVDLLGSITNHVGSGFASITDLQFGPDGALYASEFPPTAFIGLRHPRCPARRPPFMPALPIRSSSPSLRTEHSSSGGIMPAPEATTGMR